MAAAKPRTMPIPVAHPLNPGAPTCSPAGASILGQNRDCTGGAGMPCHGWPPGVMPAIAAGPLLGKLANLDDELWTPGWTKSLAT